MLHIILYVTIMRVCVWQVTVEHTGGWALWLGAGVRNASFQRGTITDVGAGAIRLGEAGHGACTVPEQAPSAFPDGAYWCNATRVARTFFWVESLDIDGSEDCCKYAI
eukprot:COSAG05_NODE_1784_length_4092_cov_122.148175_3_plen_108_part_00